ncbi:MAG: TetR family transcriptional regulator [Actinophytocola sp.]|nr:TetR family transcriptional regulator [Actinophytocola sp.]
MNRRTPSLVQAVSTLLTPATTAASVDGMPAPRMRVRFAEAARALLRETLFDAASDQLTERAWAEIRMADIAKAAGVSRQTLYKEFGSRQGFAQAYILHEAERFLAGVEQAVSEHLDDPRAALAAAIEVFLNLAAKEPLIVAIVSGEAGDGLLPLVTNRAGPVLGFATERLAGFLGDAWPGVPERSVRLIAENMIRLAISHAASATASVEETAANMAELFGPYLEGVLEASTED